MITEKELPPVSIMNDLISVIKGRETEVNDIIIIGSITQHNRWDFKIENISSNECKIVATHIDPPWIYPIYCTIDLIHNKLTINKHQ